MIKQESAPSSVALEDDTITDATENNSHDRTDMTDTPTSQQEDTPNVDEVKDTDVIMTSEDAPEQHKEAQEEATVSQEEATVSQEEATVSQEEATVSEEEATVSQEEATVSEEEATVSEEEATVSQEEATVSEEEATVSEEEATVSEEEATVSEEEATVSQEEGTVSEEEATVSEEADAEKDFTNMSFDSFSKELEAKEKPEDKLTFAIEFMTFSLSQHGSPQFKNFWETQKLCLPLFKENITPIVRSELWSLYRELSREARNLKEIFDEKSAFAIEQIDMAIKSLEDDITNFGDMLTSMDDLKFPLPSETLQKNFAVYNKVQRELNLLNTYAARINSLRKELIKTEMRIRQKNKFFQRLSAAGDSVFPKRKEYINTISQQFLDDVTSFSTDYFSEGKADGSLFAFREEIKALQNIAKVLTLNTKSFTTTRSKLSECWDIVKSQEKERKKERMQKRSIFKQNSQVILDQIKAFEEKYKDVEDFSKTEAQKELKEISLNMKDIELGRDEVHMLKDHLNELRSLLTAKERREEQERLAKEQERISQKKEEIARLKDAITSLIEETKDIQDVEDIEAKKAAIIEDINTSEILIKSDKTALEKQIERPLRDILAEKRENALLNMSATDRQALDDLRKILQDRLDHRKEIKNQLETYRKESKSSGLDFEKAMSYNEMIQQEKDNLQKDNVRIQEIENRIAELTSKV
jgi:hypothetical protein